jgi:hypothetical protein
MSHLEEAYDPSDRWAPPPSDALTPLQGIELCFAIPVHVTREQHSYLSELMEAIVFAPYNLPKGGVHWVSGCGSKVNFSQRDAQFMGIAVDPAAPEAGEPTVDSTIFTMSTSARAFVSERERSNSFVARQRAAVAREEMAAKTRKEEEEAATSSAVLQTLLQSAVAYWLLSRPADHTLAENLANPDLNTTSAEQRAFSRALVAAIKHGLVEVPQ